MGKKLGKSNLQFLKTSFAYRAQLPLIQRMHCKKIKIILSSIFNKFMRKFHVTVSGPIIPRSLMKLQSSFTKSSHDFKMFSFDYAFCFNQLNEIKDILKANDLQFVVRLGPSMISSLVCSDVVCFQERLNEIDNTFMSIANSNLRINQESFVRILSQRKTYRPFTIKESGYITNIQTFSPYTGSSVILFKEGG